MQHPESYYRQEYVENEVSDQNLLHGNRQGVDVGSLAGGRFLHAIANAGVFVIFFYFTMTVN